MLDEIPVVGLILHFRTPEKTLSCLQSLLSEGIRDVVVVDNSEDGGRSADCMRQSLTELEGRGMQTTMLQPGRNLGFAAGVNLALQEIQKKRVAHLLLINSDAVLLPDSLAEMLRRIGDLVCVAPESRASSTAAAVSPLVYYQKMLALYLPRPFIGALRYPSGTCLLLRGDQLRSDFFDDDFFFYGEDVMLGHNLANRGAEFRECASASIIHAASSSAKNGSLFYEYHMVRAHWLLALKLASNRFERVLFLIARCTTLPARAVLRCMRELSTVPLRGFLMATTDVLRGRARTLTPPA